ncbi:MAG: hypothetical protein M1826_007568 [Phylliscum demangeonii]|nr:MAG: hypothetical protein M1826_007568 [Phylliscum demangeonii]
MAPDPSAGAYGPNAAREPTGRRTWDRSEYAAKAATREANARAHYQQTQQPHPHPYPPDDPSSSLANSRASRLDVSSGVGKSVLLTGGMASVTGKRGRGAGFYCPECDLTFKDNVQWVEHLNSRQHLQNAGVRAEVKRATLEEVRARLAWLAERERERERKDREEREGDGVGGKLDLSRRFRAREEELRLEREEKRRRRGEKRRAGRKAEGQGQGEGQGEGEAGDGHHEAGRGKEEDGAAEKMMMGEGTGARADADEDGRMAALMGFAGFGTTKV